MIKTILQLIGITVVIGFATGVFNLDNETVTLDKNRAQEVTEQARNAVDRITSSTSTSNTKYE